MTNFKEFVDYVLFYGAQDLNDQQRTMLIQLFMALYLHLS